MASNTVYKFTVNNFDTVQTVEEQWLKAAKWSGITNVETPVFNYVGNVTCLDSGATGITTAFRVRKNPGSWNPTIYQQAMSVEFDMQDLNWLFDAFGTQESLSPRMAFYLDASGVPSVYASENGSTAAAVWTDASKTYPAVCHVNINTRIVSFGDDAKRPWVFMTVFINGSHVVTYAVTGYTDVGPIYMGCCTVVGTGSRTFYNVRYAELNMVGDALTIDPGEAPYSGLSRAIEGYYMKWFMRSTGSAKVFTERSSRTAVTIDANSVLPPLINNRDFRTRARRIREVAAYIESESHGTDKYVINTTSSYYAAAPTSNLLAYERFQVVNNPFITSRTRCVLEARNEMILASANFEMIEITLFANIFLEVGDHVVYNSIDYTIDGITNMSLVAGGITQTLRLRRYVELY